MASSYFPWSVPQFEEGLNEAVKAAENTNLEPLRQKMRKLDGSSLFSAVTLKSAVLTMCKPQEYDIADWTFFRYLKQEIDRFDHRDPETQTLYTRLRIKIRESTARFLQMLRDSKMASTTELQSLHVLVEAFIVVCFKALESAKRDNPKWQQKVKRYLAYGKALKDSNIERAALIKHVTRYPKELQDEIFQHMVANELPEASEFPDPYQQEIELSGGRTSITDIMLPPYIEGKQNTVDAAANFLLQSFGKVKLVTPDVQRTSEARGPTHYERLKYPSQLHDTVAQGNFSIHPGFEADISDALKAFKGRIQEAIARQMVIISLAARPIPRGFEPHAKHIKQLSLFVRAPLSSDDFEDFHRMSLIEHLHALRRECTSLQELRLAITETNVFDQSGFGMRGLCPNSDGGPIQLEAIFAEIIGALRDLKLKRVSMVYFKENAMTLSDLRTDREIAQPLAKVDRTEVEAVGLGREMVAQMGSEMMI